MKVAVNTRIYEATRTGIQHYVEKLYEICQKEDSQNEYVFFQTSKRHLLGRTRTISLIPGKIGDAIFDMVLVLWLIVCERPQIFHAPSHVLPLVRVPGVMYILTIHDCAPMTYPKAVSWIYRQYFFITTLISAWNAHAIIVVSENTKRDVVRYFKIPESKVFVQYLGIENEEWEHPQSRPIEAPYFFSVTTARRKNTEGVIRAFALFGKETGDTATRLVLSGTIDNEMQKEFTNLAHSLGVDSRVDFLGYVSHERLIALYQYSIAFVFPSFYEGFGYPVLEAIAAGTIPLTSNNSSLVELLPNDDFLVDPYDVSSIAHKMKFISELSVDVRSHHQQVLKTYSKQFSSNTNAQLFRELCNRLIKK